LEWVSTLPANSTKRSIHLQPGNYRFIFRAQRATESIFTVEKKFNIKSGLSTTVSIY